MKFQAWIAKRRIKPVRSCWHSGGETPLYTATWMGSECHACDDKIIGIRVLLAAFAFFSEKKYTNRQCWQKPLLLCMVQLLGDVETTDWRFVTTCFICPMMRNEVAPVVTSICLRGGVTSMCCCVSGCFFYVTKSYLPLDPCTLHSSRAKKLLLTKRQDISFTN